MSASVEKIDDLLSVACLGNLTVLLFSGPVRASHFQAIARLTSCVLQAGVELPYAAIRSQIADAVELILHIERRHGARLVASLIRIGRYDSAQDRYETSSLYERE